MTMNTVTDSDLLDALAAAVRQGRPVTVPVSGVSMGARFSGVDAIVITPVPFASVRIGTIIVYRRNDKWVAHRVVRVIRSVSGRAYVTKGDAIHRFDDPPVSETGYIGVVTAVQSGARITVLGFRHHFYGLWRIAVGFAAIAAARLIGRR